MGYVFFYIYLFGELLQILETSNGSLTAPQKDSWKNVKPSRQPPPGLMNILKVNSIR